MELASAAALDAERRCVRPQSGAKEDTHLATGELWERKVRIGRREGGCWTAVCSRGEILGKRFKHDLCDLEIWKFEGWLLWQMGQRPWGVVGMVLVVAAMFVWAEISRSVNKMEHHWKRWQLNLLHGLNTTTNNDSCRSIKENYYPFTFLNVSLKHERHGDFRGNLRHLKKKGHYLPKMQKEVIYKKIKKIDKLPSGPRQEVWTEQLWSDHTNRAQRLGETETRYANN